jgi:hypothetical protein
VSTITPGVTVATVGVTVPGVNIKYRESGKINTPIPQQDSLIRFFVFTVNARYSFTVARESAVKHRHYYSSASEEMTVGTT